MERTVSFATKQEQHEGHERDPLEDLVEEDVTQEMHDSSAHNTDLAAHLACRQYAVFSSTYQVPALYFSVHHRSASVLQEMCNLACILKLGLAGAPLTLQEIVASPLFRPQVLPMTRMSTFALDTANSAFALLSQGDHPTLGTPCWYLHPCRTAEVVEEIIKEVDCADVDRPLRWLEVWFMVMCNMVDFGQSGT